MVPTCRYVDNYEASLSKERAGSCLFGAGGTAAAFEQLKIVLRMGAPICVEKFSAFIPNFVLLVRFLNPSGGDHVPSDHRKISSALFSLATPAITCANLIGAHMCTLFLCSSSILSQLFYGRLGPGELAAGGFAFMQVFVGWRVFKKCLKHSQANYDRKS